MGKEANCDNCLSKAHFVSQNSIQAIFVQVAEPVNAIELIVPEGTTGHENWLVMVDDLFLFILNLLELFGHRLDVSFCNNLPFSPSLRLLFFPLTSIFFRIHLIGEEGRIYGCFVQELLQSCSLL